MYFLLAMEDNHLLQILDDRVLNEGQEVQLIVIAQLVTQCLELKGGGRPTMKEVVVELRGLRGFQDHPWFNSTAEETENLPGENSDMVKIVLSQ
ncbi:hypothetical protein AAC387_Pa05g0292 [Persea americana]